MGERDSHDLLSAARGPDSFTIDSFDFPHDQGESVFMSATVGSILMAIGVAGTWGASSAKRHARKQLSWHRVPGVIIQSEVERSDDYFVPTVVYTYTYDGRPFRGTKLCSFHVSVNWSAPARKWADRYPVGSEVTVFVDPSNAQHSVLEPGGDKKFLPIALTIAAVLVTVGGLYVAFPAHS